MPASLQGRRIAFLATDSDEQSELSEPWKAVREACAETELISLESGAICHGPGMLDEADVVRGRQGPRER
jgi:protease I